MLLGTLFFANGDKYTGEFKDNKMTGKGVLHLIHGDKYEGSFFNGTWDGEGITTKITIKVF